MSATSSTAPTVVHVRSSGGLFGADRVVLDLCRGLDATGFRAVLVPLIEPDGSGRQLAEAARDGGVEVEPLVLRRAIDVASPRHLQAISRGVGAVLLHGHDYKSDLMIALCRGPWRWVATLHGRVGTHPTLRLKEALDARVVRTFDGVICVSHELASRERKRGLRAAVVVHNGIALEPFVAPPPVAEIEQLAGELGLAAGRPVVGAVGRLSSEKGYDILLEAVARLDERGAACELVLVGDGPQAATLRQRANELGLGARVHLPGLRRDAACLYALFDVFCMPSRREGLPLALLEALAAGCAVVATPVGGIPEVVGQEGEAALLVPPEDPESLANAVGRLLADGDLRRRLSRAGREQVHREFSRQRMTAGVAALYHRWFAPDPGNTTAHLDAERSDEV